MPALRSFALALVTLVVAGCSPIASSPTPTVIPSPSATPAAATVSPSPTASAPARVQLSNAPVPATAGKLLLFQLPDETGLRAITWDASVNGTLPGAVRPNAVWVQSPDGAPYLLENFVFGRDGNPVGPVGWPSKVTATWSAGGRSLCAAVPEREVTGSAMNLERLTLGQPARVVATGFATFSDNAVYRVLMCDEGADRAIVASFGQGIAPAKLWVFRLSTGAVIRSVDYAGTLGWVAASADGTMLVETLRFDTASGRWSATIRSADDGTKMGAVDGFVGQGFSGDNTLLVGASESSAAVVDWKTGRAVWSASGPYGGFLAEPAGRRLAIGIGFVGGSDQRDVYIVSADGSASLLPARVRVALRY
ncbi:MAG TPA: hypothetical protein VKE23_06580 [Candidatus Limnocylindria bacterium]|nr:hypothetical protein [Candidatus Limnocylindria bacterium]